MGKIIANELRQQLGGTESDCPETETLAAFYDRTLTDRERGMWEKHFLKCLRCQEYLAELARLADADESPTMLAGDAAKAEPDDSPGWFYRLAWVIPFLIIGVASAIWYREEIERYFPQTQETAVNIQPPPPESLPQQGAAPEGEAKQAAGLKDLAKTGPAPVASIAVAKPKTEERRDELSAIGSGQKALSGAGGAMATPSERANMREAVEAPQRALESEIADKKSQLGDQPVPAAAAPPVAPPKPADGDHAAARKESSPYGALSGLTIRGVQPKVAAKWRVGRRGTIQKADETGKWERVPSGVDDDLFDITFAGDAGWAVGHEGTVLRSTDGGNTWRKVPAPTTEDLVRVSTKGADQALVITRSGKSFSTNDGGQSWK